MTLTVPVSRLRAPLDDGLVQTSGAANLLGADLAVHVLG
jgi:hypothetical protein